MIDRVSSFVFALPLALGVCVSVGSGVGCGGPLSSAPPRASAASLDADVAPSARVSVALESDPPLPGESTEGWRGLAPPDAAAGGAHGGHPRHHHTADAADADDGSDANDGNAAPTSSREVAP